MELHLQGLKRVTNWGVEVNRTLLIAGPCSAETEEQVMKTAEGVRKCGAQIFRAGVWKPRTRPNSFEGIGIEALRWVKNAGIEMNMKVAVEVADPSHVEEALKSGIDVLWIGARTTVNPFSVQAIADSVRGVDVPVMVKNPVNPELELWIGALERISRAGITGIAAIHRGFSTQEKAVYRNTPKWEIPIELKRLAPDLPLICDPSHICGNTALLQSVAQQALDMDFDGLMMESHIKPQEAWSDAKQQLTPEGLSRLLEGLSYKKDSIDNPVFRSALDHLRGEIDKLDGELIELLAKRMEIVEEIGRIKKQSNIAFYQPQRWAEIVKSRIIMGRDRKISEEFLFRLFQHIHQESLEVQSGRKSVSQR